MLDSDTHRLRHSHRLLPSGSNPDVHANNKRASSSARSRSPSSSSHSHQHSRKVSSGSESTLESEMEDWEDAVSFFEGESSSATATTLSSELGRGTLVRLAQEAEESLEDLGWGVAELLSRLEDRSPSKGKGKVVEKEREVGRMKKPRRARLPSGDSDIHPPMDRVIVGTPVRSCHHRRASSSSDYAVDASTFRNPSRPTTAQTMRRAPLASSSSSSALNRHSFTSTDVNELDIHEMLRAYDEASQRYSAPTEITPTRRRTLIESMRAERVPSPTRHTGYSMSLLDAVHGGSDYQREPLVSTVPSPLFPARSAAPFPLPPKKTKAFSTLHKKAAPLPPTATRSIPPNAPTHLPSPQPASTPFLDGLANSRRGSLMNQSIISSDSVPSSMRSMGGSVSSGSGRSGSSNSFRWSIASASTARTIAEEDDGDKWSSGGSRRPSYASLSSDHPAPARIMPETYSCVSMAPREMATVVEGVNSTSMRFRTNSGGPTVVSGDGMEAEVDWDNLFGDRTTEDLALPSPTLSTTQLPGVELVARPSIRSRKALSSKLLSKSRSEVAPEPMPTVKSVSKKSSLAGLGRIISGSRS